MIGDLLMKAIETVAGPVIKERGFEKRLRAAIDLAIERYRSSHGAKDAEVTRLLLDDLRILDLPSVVEALRTLPYAQLEPMRRPRRLSSLRSRSSRHLFRRTASTEPSTPSLSA